MDHEEWRVTKLGLARWIPWTQPIRLRVTAHQVTVLGQDSMPLTDLSMVLRTNLILTAPGLTAVVPGPPEQLRWMQNELTRLKERAIASSADLDSHTKQALEDLTSRA